MLFWGWFVTRTCWLPCFPKSLWITKQVLFSLCHLFELMNRNICTEECTYSGEPGFNLEHSHSSALGCWAIRFCEYWFFHAETGRFLCLSCNPCHFAVSINRDKSTLWTLPSSHASEDKEQDNSESKESPLDWSIYAKACRRFDIRSAIWSPSTRAILQNFYTARCLKFKLQASSWYLVSIYSQINS